MRKRLSLAKLCLASILVAFLMTLNRNFNIRTIFPTKTMSKHSFAMKISPTKARFHSLRANAAFKAETTTHSLHKGLTMEYTGVETFKLESEKVNEFKFKFLSNPVEKCSTKMELTRKRMNRSRSGYSKSVLLFMVKSATQNRRRRDAIRSTWGNEDFIYSDAINIRTVFVLGLPVNGSLKNIVEEFNVHHDIIQVNFIDTYFNNTLKTISNINWASKYCLRARYVVLLDDDFFVNPRNLFKMLDGLPVEKRNRLYMGRVYKGYEPHRNRTSKWFVSESEYPFKKYPTFVSAGTIVLSMDVVRELQKGMEYIKPFKLDDIYVAIVAQHLMVTPRAHPEIHGNTILYGNKHFHKLITAHGYQTQDILNSWKKTFPSLYIK